MNPQICSQCGEENPVEAIMCWACYTPLEGADASLSHVNNSLFTFLSSDRQKWLNKANIIALCFLACGLLPNRWRHPKTRFTMVGLSLATMVVIYGMRKWQQTYPQRATSESDPIASIADTIFFYALRDQATQIRLRLVASNQLGGIQVHYQIRGEWEEQMKIPTYIWRPLINEYIQRSGSGTIKFDQDEKNAHFQLRLVIEPPQEEIILTVLDEA